MAALEDIVSNLRNGVTSLSKIALTLSSAFPATVAGTFTLANATTTVVPQTGVVATSVIFLSPTNATAALTARSAGVFISAVSAGVSFTVSTQNGSATGNETFSYVVYP